MSCIKSVTLYCLKIKLYTLMKRYVFPLFIVLFATSCEKKITENINTSTTPPDSVTVPEYHEPVESSTLQTCYLGNVGKDSVFISLHDNLGTIIGTLRYKNFEKDSSAGDITGAKNGDTLKLQYSFESEGMKSEREIYFLVKEDQLVEGIGEQKTESNSAKYKDYAKISFNGPSLHQTDCQDFDKNFKSK